jgi:hypothetical protein
MPELEDEPVELREQIEEVTREQAEANPELRADPAEAKKGVLDDEDPAEFEQLELEAAVGVVLGDADDESGGAAPPISAHQQRMLALAVTQKGMREQPAGSNNNMYSRYFGFGAQFWCADFIAYCLDMTGNKEKKVPWGYPSAVKNITAWGQRNGKIQNMPMKGDIFTRRNAKHAGFVLSSNGTKFMTIEGNTTGPDGDLYVASHSRDAAGEEYFFVRHTW